MLTFALVASVNGPLPVSAEDRQPVDDVDVAASVPMLESSESLDAAPSLPAGRFSPSTRPPQSERVAELVDERTATSDTWVYGDGTRSVTVSAEPRFFQPVGSGQWEPIDTSVLQDERRAGWFRSAANRWTARFGPSDAASGMQQVDLPDATIGFVPVDAPVRARPEVEGSTATYRDLWPHTDVVYTVTSLGTDERIVLWSKDSPASFAFDVIGAEPRLRADAGVDLFLNDAVLGSVPAPTVQTADGLVDPSEPGVVFSVEPGASDRGGRDRLRVSVDREWLDAQPESAFPVVIDPTFTPAAPSTPTTVKSVRSSGPAVYGTAQAGVDGSDQVWRAAAYVPIPDPPVGGTQPWYLVDATLRVDRQAGSIGTCVCSLTARGAEYEPSFASMTNGPVLQPLEAGTADFAFDVSSWVASHPGDGVWYGFIGDEVLSHDLLHMLATPSSNGITVEYFFFRSADPTHLVSPEGTISTTTPILTAEVVEPPDSDPGFDTVYYDFKIATAPDGSGQVVDSGWVESPAWTVPPGVLADGVTYYVRVWNNIGYPWSPGSYGYYPPAEPTTVKTLTVKAHLGAGGPAPTDTVGAIPGSTPTPSEGAPSPSLPSANVTVNMVTGNLSATVGTKSLPALGGSAGVSLHYDSLGSRALDGGTSGLYGKYSSAGQQIGQRLDPSIDFSWTGSPMGGHADASPIDVEWQGVIRMPASGTWKLGGYVAAGGTMSIFIDGNSYAVITGGGSAASFGTNTIPANTQHTIRVTYSAPQGVARVGQLWAYNTTAPAEDPQQKFVVPGTWLAPRATGLPADWQLSVNPHAGSWTRLEDLGAQVVVHSSTGATATFERLADGTYRPPAGSTALLSTRHASPSSGIPSGSDDTYELTTADNVQFIFGQDGWVQSVRSIADDSEPTALQYSYTSLAGTPLGAPVLTTITDPVTQRSISLCYGAGCADGDPSWHVPDGMLGRIDHWDNTTTELRYDTNSGQLSRVIAPGDLVADFGYDTQQRLISVRDPLANAALAAGQRPDCVTDPAQCLYSVGYDPDGRVSSVQQPAPIAGAARPQRSYDWTQVANRRATVQVANGAQPALTATTVWDEQSRVIEQHDAAGRISYTKWDPNIDRPVAVIDVSGLQTTSLYDPFTENLTDEYGPAPTSCFDTTFPFAPTGTCSGVPRTQHLYDEGMNGLRATFWANPYFAGAPASHTTGFGGAQGTSSDPLQCPTGTRVLTCVVWPSLPVTPAGGSIPVAGNAFTWSARFEGSISSPSEFVINLETSQHVTVYVDGALYDEIDARAANTPYTHTYGAWPAPWVDPDLLVLPAGAHSIRIDYLGSSTSANGLWIDWSSNLLASRECAVDTTDMVAWWTGEGSLAAEIGAPATGTVSFAPGHAGQGLQFNANQVTVPDFPVITNGLTVEAWVKPQLGQYDIGTIMSRYRWAAYDPNNSYWLYLSNGAHFVLDDTSTLGPEWTSTGAGQLYDGNFHHVAATWDGYWAKLYIDGQLAISNAYYPSSQILNAATGIDFRIGSYGFGAWFIGTIDEPAVFRRSLSATEIDAIYDAGSAGKCDAAPPSGVSLAPMHGLETTTIDPDGKVVATSYTDPGNGIGPHHRLTTAVVQDPNGLALTTATSYENPANGGWLRTAATSLPGGGTTTWSHYCGNPQAGCAPNEIAGAIDTACGVTAGTPQWGLPSQQADPAPVPGFAARTQQFLYDVAGRTVGRRVGPTDTISAAPWQCTTYDSAGRVLSQTWPTPGAGVSPRSTTTYAYSVGGNPLRASVSDSSGTISSTVDLLGRIVSYTDTWGRTTTTTYDQAGRASVIDGPEVDLAYTYTTTGELDVATAAVSGTQVADATVGYDMATGRATSVAYQGGLIDLTIGYDALGRQSSVTYTKDVSPTPTRIAGHEASYSAGGRKINVNVDTGTANLVDPNPTGDDYVYDGAGRLTTAHLIGGRADYGYGVLGGSECNSVAGNNSDAGRNTNRTAVTWTPTGGAAAVQASCYNRADQVISTTDTAGSTAFTYDARGNTTTAGADTYHWDASDRVAYVSGPSGNIIYSRDPLDRLTSRYESAYGESILYSYSGHTDAPTTILDEGLYPLQHLIGLPGGVLLTVYGTELTFSLRDLHGHTIAMANSTGDRVGALHTYDPWGVEHPASTLGIDNLYGNLDQGAFGTAGRLSDGSTASPIVLMGARLYSPTQGRFLSVDPLKGGCANDYVYVHGDPVNHADTTGKGDWWNPFDNCILGRNPNGSCRNPLDDIWDTLYDLGATIVEGVGDAVVCAGKVALDLVNPIPDNGDLGDASASIGATLIKLGGVVGTLAGPLVLESGAVVAAGSTVIAATGIGLLVVGTALVATGVVLSINENC